MLGTTVGQHLLIHRFMKGAHRFLSVTRRGVPEWDLSMVLEASSQQSFEPLGDIQDLLSFKTALLLALASAKLVSDLHVLSVHPSYTKFSLSEDKVFLWPNQAFMLKCFPAFTCEVLELSAFHPPPFSSVEDQRLNAFCPVHDLRVHINRTIPFRWSDQAPHQSNRERLRAHSTRSMAAWWALFKGVSLQDICSAASWASPHTFIRHYWLDVIHTPVAHSVLGMGSS